MTRSWAVEAPRLASLARLDLSEEELASLAQACEAITREFAQLGAYAASLPDAPPPAPAALREDIVAPAPVAEVEGILRASPRADLRSRKLRVPRGLP